MLSLHPNTVSKRNTLLPSIWPNPRDEDIGPQKDDTKTLGLRVGLEASPLSRRLSRPPSAICAKPASRPRKLRRSRELAEKNIRLSRRENCGLNTKQINYYSFQHPQVNRHGLLRHPSSELLCRIEIGG